MDRPTFNHRKSGDTNPKGRSRSPLLELYARSLKSEREEKIGARSFCRLRRQTAPGLYVRRGQKDGKRDYKLSTETGQVQVKERRLGNLATPASVQKLQMALRAKAKTEAGYRFYALYDKIYREDILAHAYAQCRSNKGAPGVDGQDFADVETYGMQRWLGELALALKEETYRPDPIRRVFIPKANGNLRPLGISTLRDRVCMTAAMLVLDPIFDADLPSEQYAYRSGRNAQQAVIDVEETLFAGHLDVVDADLADYFGSIPHADLMRSLARRIVDSRVLHLIKMWLECAVEETDDRGRKKRTTEAKDSGRGIPQGSPISPLTQKRTSNL